MDILECIIVFLFLIFAFPVFALTMFNIFFDLILEIKDKFKKIKESK